MEFKEMNNDELLNTDGGGDWLALGDVLWNFMSGAYDAAKYYTSLEYQFKHEPLTYL